MAFWGFCLAVSVVALLALAFVVIQPVSSDGWAPLDELVAAIRLKGPATALTVALLVAIAFFFREARLLEPGQRDRPELVRCGDMVAVARAGPRRGAPRREARAGLRALGKWQREQGRQGLHSSRVRRHLHLRQMSVLGQVQDDVKSALKAGDRERVHALRLIADALQKAEKDNGGEPDEVLQRERKRRLEAAEAYRDGGRTDAAEAEEREAEVIASYLPEQLSDDELREIVGNAVAESGASSPQEMGKVMGVVMPQVKGRADGKRVSTAVKEMLTP